MYGCLKNRIESDLTEIATSRRKIRFGPLRSLSLNMSTSEAAEEDITDPHETRFSVDTSMEDTSDVLGEHRVNERVSSSSLTHEEPVSGRRTTTLLLSPSRKSKRILTRKKTRGSPKYLRDAITVEIPLSVTADFKIAIQRTRSKRVQSIYKAFPILKKLLKKPSQRGGDEDDDDDEDDSKADDPMDGEDATSNKDPTDEKENNGKPSRRKKKKILPHVPQPEQYGSVLDYLEAKYVRGVMLVDDEGGDGSMGGDGSEGAGSIYSGGSFLDDTDLQRDVAEQVLANTTLTKLELEHEDGEFFVNVGNLEVEENQYGEDYDPIQDKDVVKATKKRRRVVQPANPEATKPTTAAKMKKTVKEEKKDTSAQSTTSKKSIASTGSQKKKLPVLEKKADSEKKVAPAKKVAPEKKVVPEKKLDPEKKPVDDEPTTTIITDSKTLAANEAKKKSDGLFNDLAAEIKKMTKEELPRRKKNLTVSLTCPPNKNPGDTVTFTYVPIFDTWRDRLLLHGMFVV